MRMGSEPERNMLPSLDRTGNVIHVSFAILARIFGTLLSVLIAERFKTGPPFQPRIPPLSRNPNHSPTKTATDCNNEAPVHLTHRHSLLLGLCYCNNRCWKCMCTYHFTLRSLSLHQTHPIQTTLQTLLNYKVSFPGTTIYANESASYWSAQESSLSPLCRVTPTNAEDVSTILRVVVAWNQTFAVKGGGHSKYSTSLTYFYSTLGAWRRLNLG